MPMRRSPAGRPKSSTSTRRSRCNALRSAVPWHRLSLSRRRQAAALPRHLPQSKIVAHAEHAVGIRMHRFREPDFFFLIETRLTEMDVDVRRNVAAWILTGLDRINRV